MSKTYSQMEVKRLAELFRALAGKLDNVKSARSEADRIVFETEVVKPHITYTELVELPMADWFLERYCL